MRAIGCVLMGFFTLSALACGFGKSRSTLPDEASSPAREKPPVAGRIKATQILFEYYDPNTNPNRAILADKYFGKYWELDLNDVGYSVDEDRIRASIRFGGQLTTEMRFRDKKDLLKFTRDEKGRRNGPTLIVGKAVSDDKFEDCFIP